LPKLCRQNERGSRLDWNESLMVDIVTRDVPCFRDRSSSSLAGMSESRARSGCRRCPTFASLVPDECCQVPQSLPLEAHSSPLEARPSPLEAEQLVAFSLPSWSSLSSLSLSSSMVVPPVRESLGVFLASTRCVMPSRALLPCQSNHFTSREMMTRFASIQ
jgi:hypothetical protein